MKYMVYTCVEIRRFAKVISKKEIVRLAFNDGEKSSGNRLDDNPRGLGRKAGGYSVVS